MEMASEGLRGTERGSDGQESGSHAGALRSVRVEECQGWLERVRVCRRDQWSVREGKGGTGSVRSDLGVLERTRED